MPGTAVVYDTNTIVQAAPPDATAVIIATIPSVSTGQNFGRVRLFATLVLAPGANITGVTLRWYRNLVAAATPAGPAFTVTNVAAATAQNFVCAGDENPPPGVHTYNLYLTATGMTAAGTISALVATAVVGG